MILLNLQQLGMASALETLCGQAFGAKKYHMLGTYMQRSWIVLFACATLLLPPPGLAAAAGKLSVWFIPVHYSFVFILPLQRFLQCQLRNAVHAVVSAVVVVVHLIATWLFVYRCGYGLFGAAMILNFSWWLGVVLLMGFVICGGCGETWMGFSMRAFDGLWEFLKLSAASGVMLCLENWYYRILIVLAGNIKNAAIAVDALSICISINGWELMIPLAFFAATGVRVANELGANNSRGARFATINAVITSSIIGVFFSVLVVALHNKVAYIFTISDVVIRAVDNLSLLLALTILLNSVQPILSGVAVGSGWQSIVAYVNIGSYYLIGIPLGILMGWLLHLGVLGIWAGMIGGTAIQTLILAIMTIKCDWDKEVRILDFFFLRKGSRRSAPEDVGIFAEPRKFVFVLLY
ncbi:protein DETOXIFICATION 27-like [Phalaenopsis equestris]|uniref:protein DETOXIFICATION 27-like n=1 Tax=Phalaenopsis equestris TaxID=78828 RepID=UPI0009E5CDDD|nr:protein DETOXIFICATION 27-like [Phalaenopsis equestris]